MPIHLLRVPPLWLLRHPHRHCHLALRLCRHRCSHCLQLLPACLLWVSLCGCCALDAVQTLSRACSAWHSMFHWYLLLKGSYGIPWPGGVLCYACCFCWRNIHQSKQFVRLPSADNSAEQCAALLQIHVHPPLAALLPGSQHCVRWAGPCASTGKHKPVLLPLAAAAQR